MEIVLLAALAMVFQDVLGVMMVQAEARDRGWLAGWLDGAGWLFAIATTSISVTALQGHNTSLKIAVVVAVSVANVLGSKLGQIIGTRFIKPTPNPIVKLLIDKDLISANEWLETQHPKNRYIKHLQRMEQEQSNIKT